MGVQMGGGVMALLTRDIGGGGDFTDWYAFWVWLLANDNPGANDYVCTQISSFNMTGSMVGAGSWASNGHSVEFVCPFANSHQGNPLGGYKTTCPFGTGGIAMKETLPAAGAFTVDGLWIDCSAVAATALLVQATRGGLNVVRNCLVKGNAGADRSAVIVGNVDTSLVQAYNLKIWNAGAEGFGWHTSTGGGVVGEKIVENVTIWDCGKNMNVAYASFSLATPGYTARNIVVAASGKNYNMTVGSDYINCADHDGTLTGAEAVDPQHDVVDTDEFQSIAEGNAKFLFLKDSSFDAEFVGVPLVGPAPLSVAFTDLSGYTYPSAKLSDNGIVPVNAGATDIAGEPRPSDESVYAIGCHEVVLA